MMTRSCTRCDGRLLHGRRRRWRSGGNDNSRSRQAGRRAAFILVPMLTLFIKQVLVLASTGHTSAAGDHAVQVSWEFDRSDDEWARAASVEMNAEITWTPSGTLRGTIRGPSPHLDSPVFRILVHDRQHVAIRMRSSGAASRARIELRTGQMPRDADHSLNPWTTRNQASVVVDSSSSGGNNVTLAADGDLTTIWEAASNTNEWITMDLGDVREVAALRLQAPGGDGNPRNVRLQGGLSAGGKFGTVANLTLTNSSTPQHFNVLPTTGRYWRLYILDGYGADRTSLREVTLLGPAETTIPEPLDFEVTNDNAFHVYYVPIHRSLHGVLTQLRLRPGIEDAEVIGRHNSSLSPKRGDSFEIDWIRIVRAPRVKRVRGCIDLAYVWPDTPEVGRGFAISNVTARNVLVNGVLDLRLTSFGIVEAAAYATTKSCLRGGGERIAIAGAAFGPANARVYIDGVPCTDVEHTPGREETELSCLTPTMTVAARKASTSAVVAPYLGTAYHDTANITLGSYSEWTSTVEVVNGRLSGLTHDVRYLSYQAPPPPIRKPSISNVAARALDISWEAPSNYWEALAITGYQIGWRSVGSGHSVGNSSASDGHISAEGQNEAEHVMTVGNAMFQMTVGNVTTTTVRGLTPGTLHAFWVWGLSENRSDPAGQQVDLYGRRDALEGAVAGISSEHSDLVATLAEDISFERFDANSTLNHSAVDPSSTFGPRGQWAGEGHYGLQLVGTAQIENCNRSASCCDGYDKVSGSCERGAEGSQLSCSAMVTPGQTWPLAGDASLVAPPLSGGAISTTANTASTASSSTSLVSRLPPSALIGPYEAAVAAGWGAGVSQACGPALRLTASRPASAGAAWYARDITVGEGFDATFTFRLSSPSLRCNTMEGVHTYCRSRGADGLAFVVQGEGPTALGRGGMGLGYAGISNMLAIEFDTYYNPDMLDQYENHVSVQARQWRDPGSAHASYSLGSTPNVPDLTDGNIEARVVHTPMIKADDVFHPAFQASGHLIEGLEQWGVGLGILRVYVGNLHEPCLVVPFNLEGTLRLNHGRAFVGFTAATGRDTWQVHDVLRWSFSSLRQDTPYWPPPIVSGFENGSGANDTANDGQTGDETGLLPEDPTASRCDSGLGDVSCLSDI